MAPYCRLRNQGGGRISALTNEHVGHFGAYIDPYFTQCEFFLPKKQRDSKETFSNGGMKTFKLVGSWMNKVEECGNTVGRLMCLVVYTLYIPPLPPPTPAGNPAVAF